MATTSPDNLFSPNPSDNYNLIADWATSMQSVQAALVKRGNMYVGTSTQRTAFTTPPDGVHWQDTNGTKLEYVRQDGRWYGVSPLGGTVTLTPPSGGGQVTQNLTFPTGYFRGAPLVMATPQTGAGVTVAVNVSVGSVTQTSAVLNLNRSNGTATTISWVAFQAS